MRIRCAGRLAGIMAISVLAFSGAAMAQEKIKLKIAHFLPPGSNAQTKLIEPWAERVNKAANGRFEIEIYPSMQLGGKPPQLFDQVRTGVADVVWTLPGYTPGRFPKTEVFELPFMTAATSEATTSAIWDIYQKHLQDEYKDVKVLLLHCHAPGLVHTKDKPVKTMADLDGLKIRLPVKPIGEALKYLGATPIGMPVPEVYEALSRGVVDGTVIPWEVVSSIRTNELTKYHTNTGLYTSVFLFAMNKDKYESLPDDLKKAIDDASAATLAEIGKAYDEAELPGLKQAKEMGHEILTLSPEERAKWEKTTQPVIDAWIKRTPNGKAIYDDAVAAIAKYEQAVSKTQ